MKPTGKEIQNIVSQVRELTWCHAIWWEVVDVENRSANARAFEEYTTYFVATTRMLQEEIVIIICRLFEDKEDVCSFPTLIKKLGSTYSAEAQKLNHEIFKCDQVLKHCRRVRNKVHAHRDSKLMPEDVYKSVDLKVRDLDVLCELCENLAASLSGIHGANSKHQILNDIRKNRDDAVSETRSLLDTLSAKVGL